MYRVVLEEWAAERHQALICEAEIGRLFRMPDARGVGRGRRAFALLGGWLFALGRPVKTERQLARW